MESLKNTPDAAAQTKGAGRLSPWAWVPSLYFAEGVPYVIIITLSALLYKDLGLTDKQAAFYTSLLYLPWVIKPFWSPIVDVLRTKRWWIVTMEAIVGAGFAAIAFTLPTSGWLQWSLAIFYLLAFASATHDIAADGFYMLALDEGKQALFVGIRSTFYRIATIAAQGGLLLFAGWIEHLTGKTSAAWAWTITLGAAVFAALTVYHYAVLPHPAEDKATATAGDGGRTTSFKQIVEAFVSFVCKPHFLVAISFLLLFRLPEALISKISPLFLRAELSEGGLALSKEALGIAQGTVGVIGLTVGGILGGIVASRWGFRRALWPMVLAITLPDVVYVALAYWQTSNLYVVSTCLGIEQFGYGFGFTAYMLFMLYFAQGESKTTHYAFCTGFMALSMMLPGLFSGWLAEQLGYLSFFILVVALVPVTFLASAIIKVPADFGKEKA